MGNCNHSWFDFPVWQERHSHGERVMMGWGGVGVMMMGEDGGRGV